MDDLPVVPAGLRAVRIGPKLVPGAKPDAYILLEDKHGPRLCLELFRDSDQAFAFQAGELWGEYAVVGWGHRLYLLHLLSLKLRTIELGSYFGHLYLHAEFLLVASAERLFRIQSNGEIHWSSELLGVDGVLVEDISDGTITGSGEWDPPGGWCPFRLALDTGRQISNSSP